MKMKQKASRKRGFILITVGLSLLAVVAMTGLAVDLGRIYIAKNESQSYVDAAALSAVLELDGTLAGIERARGVVLNSTNRWNLGNNSFANPQVEFALLQDGPWETNPAIATGYRFVRVGAGVQVPVNFMSAITEQLTTPVNAMAVASQALREGMREGTFPFSPLAHDPVTKPHFGLTPKKSHTLRWAANPNLGKNTCPGDDVPSVIALAEAGSGSERGYIEDTSASIIRDAIIFDFQTVVRQIGDAVNMTGGAKQTQLDAIGERIAQDTDPNSATYTEYLAAGLGNGRRLVAALINTGNPDYTVVQVGAFFLLPVSQYNKGGNQPFCAEYVGPYMQGSKYSGGAVGAGYYVARLVQ